MTNHPGSIYTIPTGPDLFYLTHSCPDLTSTHPSDFQYSTSLSPTVSIASSDSSTRGISPILSAMPGRKEPWSLSHQSTMDNGSVYDPVTLTPLSSRYNDDDRSVLSAASSRDYASGSESPSPTGSIYNGHAYSSSQVSFDDFIGKDGRCISPTERKNTQALRDFYGTIPDTNIDFYPNIDSPGEHERSRRSSWASSHGTRNSVRSLASSLRDKTSSVRSRVSGWKRGLTGGQRSETTGRSSSVPPSSSARGFSSSWRR